MRYNYDKKECPYCGRKILVESIRIGTNHTSSVAVMCLECLMKNGINEDFEKISSEIAKDIEDWHSTSTPSKNQEIEK